MDNFDYQKYSDDSLKVFDRRIDERKNAIRLECDAAGKKLSRLMVIALILVFGTFMWVFPSYGLAGGLLLGVVFFVLYAGLAFLIHIKLKPFRDRIHELDVASDLLRDSLNEAWDYQQELPINTLWKPKKVEK